MSTARYDGPMIPPAQLTESWITCPVCHGTGALTAPLVGADCPRCHGHSQTRITHTDAPQGVPVSTETDPIAGPWMAVLSTCLGHCADTLEAVAKLGDGFEIAVVRGTAIPAGCDGGLRRPDDFDHEDVLYQLEDFENDTEFTFHWARAQAVADALNAQSETSTAEPESTPPDSTDAEVAARVLALPMQPNDADATTIRDYLIKLLGGVWEHTEGFDGKRPFGNSGWQHELYQTLAEAGMVISGQDRYGDLDVDRGAAYLLIQHAIQHLGASAPASTS